MFLKVSVQGQSVHCFQACGAASWQGIGNIAKLFTWEVNRCLGSIREEEGMLVPVKGMPAITFTRPISKKFHYLLEAPWAGEQTHEL